MAVHCNLRVTVPAHATAAVAVMRCVACCACGPSLTPDGVEDKHSLHGSCPTTKGEKWSATK